MTAISSNGFKFKVIGSSSTNATAAAAAVSTASSSASSVHDYSLSARKGTLSVRNNNDNNTSSLIATPHLMLHSLFGSVPHVSPDILKQHILKSSSLTTTSPQIFMTALEHFHPLLSAPDAVKAFSTAFPTTTTTTTTSSSSPPINKYCALPENVFTIATMRDVADVMNGTQRKHEAGIHAKFINGYSKGCSVKATAEEYAQMGVVLGVDILVGPINTAIVPAASGCSNDASSVPIIPGSNMRKKVDKGIQFLEALVSSLKNKQQITNITTPRVFAVLDGQDDLKARWWNTVQLKEKFQEDDEIIAGYVVPLFFLQPSTFEHDGGDDAAGCKMKETITPAKPSTQVFSSAFIFDAQLVSSSHRHQHHQQQEEVEERRGRDRQETIKKVLQTTFAALPANKPRVVVGVGSLEDIRTCIECGVDLIDGSWLANLAERGIVLNLEGESTPTSSSSYCINPHSSSSSGNYTQDMAVLVPGCGCFACSGEMHYARSYIQHLYEVGEMLGYAILQIHNHHQCSEWMQRIREEI